MTVQSDHNESKIKTCPGWTKSYFKQPKSDYQIFITKLNNRCKQHYLPFSHFFLKTWHMWWYKTLVLSQHNAHELYTYKL